jgi:cob(I)alamin adenosyltransferase
MKIYTKGGDQGETGLIGGVRVPKDDIRVSAYGEVDELNAVLGVVIAHSTPDDAQRNALLTEIQKDLFAVGAHLADPRATIAGRKPKTALDDQHVLRLEQAIDERETRLEPLKSFLLPGGSVVGSCLHLARGVCRRAERHIVALHRESPVEAVILIYVNRLADLLFVLAREANAREGHSETPW